MGLIRDVGGKLVQSFLSLDDLILGQGLVGEGVSQLSLTGKTAAGSLVVGSNLAARGVHIGVQAGAKTAAATAGAFEGLVPGAGMARAWAERVDKESAAAGEEAAQLASHAVELTGGETPKNPLTQEPWMGKGAPRGYSWGELAADTAVGSFGRFATLPVMLGLDAGVMAADSDVGRMAIDSTFRGLGMLLDLLPGGSSSELDSGELRESLAAVTASSGSASAKNSVGLAEGAARMAFGDTRKLRAALDSALEEMQLLADHGGMDDLMPALRISSTVRARARNVVEHAPKKLLAALGRGPGGEAPEPGTVLSALLDDAQNLRVFLTDYPQVVSLMAVNAGLLLTAGMVDASEIEAFVQEDDGDEDRSRPWSAAELESMIGDAPDGAFPDAAVDAARGLAFCYSSEVLGREKALARAERLYGREARQQLEDDISLDLDVLRAERGEERGKKIRQAITATDTRDLGRNLEAGQEQLDSLDAFTGTLLGYQPKLAAERKDVLRTFVGLGNQEVGQRGVRASQGSAERRAARQAFDSWLEAEVA